jgi:Tfp pilus assembly protein PilN
VATINLIPPKIKKAQQAARVSRLVSSVLFSILIMFLIVLGAVYAVDSLVKEELSSSDQRVADAEFKLKSLKDVEDSINSVNAKLTRLDALKTQNIAWTDVLAKFSSAVPEKIQITSIQTDQPTKKFVLNGIAPSRREIVMLQTKLEDSDYFSGVTFGSSVLDDKTNTFTFSLTGDFKK